MSMPAPMDESIARAPEPLSPMGDAAAACKWIREHRDQLLAHFCRLVQTPSDNPPGDCRAAADVAEAELGRLGIPVERYEVNPGDGPPLPTVLGWLGPWTDTPDLVLNAHLDASPPTPEWTVPAYAALRRDGHVFGRGATLSKSDVAAYSYALAAAAHALSGSAQGTAVVALTADEGSGGDHGPRHLVEERGLRPRHAITAGLTHQVGIAHNGAIQARLTVRGRATHQAVVPPDDEAMRHAIAIAWRIVREGDELRRKAGKIDGIAHPTLNVTRIAGGELPGLAPGTVELLTDRRVMPEESTEVVLDELLRLIDEMAQESGAKVDVEMVQRAEPLRPTPESEHWARIVAQEAEAVQGRVVPLRGIPLYTDARWFGAHGIPTALYGTGADDLAAAGVNGQDENVAEADLYAAAEAIARVVTRVLTPQR